MNIVVTGGAGFIGANLCRELVARDGVGRVRVIDNLSTGAATNLRGVDVDLIEGSILDRALLESTMHAADVVIHLAARPSVPRSVADPIASHEANATGTLYVLEACRAAGARIVLSSSSSVYGNVTRFAKHEDLPTRPQSPYAASKLAAESYALAFAATYQVPTLAFRFFNVYGPLQSSGHVYAAVIPVFIDAILRGQSVPVHGDGDQTRDFTFVGSVVQVLIEAAMRGVTSSTPVNLAYGTRTSLRELLTCLGELTGGRVDAAFEPARAGDVRDSQAANDRLRALFPDLGPTPLRIGLARTVEWFRQMPRYGDVNGALPEPPARAAAQIPSSTGG